MPHTAQYIGQRLSLKHQLCTVRYVGAVADKPGEWPGVEWDDPERGKHDGTHNGIKYFTCKAILI
jgi:tubulin-specific chaperone E